jgi:hypothetical protein
MPRERLSEICNSGSSREAHRLLSKAKYGLHFFGPGASRIFWPSTLHFFPASLHFLLGLLAFLGASRIFWPSTLHFFSASLHFLLGLLAFCGSSREAPAFVESEMRINVESEDKYNRKRSRGPICRRKNGREKPSAVLLGSSPRGADLV